MRASDESLNGLRNRVVKSRLYSAGSDEAMLRVSPVATEELASRICTLARGCGGEDIQCRIIAEQNPQALTLQQAPVTSLSSSPAVQLSRRDAERRMVRGGDASTGQLWVQLGSAASQGRAAQRFETLQQQHEDLLGGYVADISTPPRVGLARTIYRLRVGPFTARGAADQLCNKLEARNVSCLVVTE